MLPNPLFLNFYHYLFRKSMVKKFRQNFRSYVLVAIRRLRVTAWQVADYSLKEAQPGALL